MISRFLRPPAGFLQYTADAVRILGLLSVAAGFVWWSATDAGILAMTLPALVVPRFLGARSGFDIAYGLTVLIAAWSNVLELYTTVPRWDLAVHLVCTGVLAAMAFVALAELGVLDAPSTRATRKRVPIVVVPTIGLALSAVWEMIEWVGFTFISTEIFVAYDDTIGDMVFGGCGAVIAGVIAARVRLVREDVLPPQDRNADSIPVNPSSPAQPVRDDRWKPTHKPGGRHDQELLEG